jgi:hypothetical protein
MGSDVSKMAGALWFLGGGAAAFFGVWTLHLAAARLTPERRRYSVGWFVGSFVLRVLLTALVLALAFRHMLVSGLLAWLGYYVCRTILTWRLARRLEGGRVS